MFTPNRYVFSVCYMIGLQVDFEMLIAWTSFNTLDDYIKYLDRLKAIPKRLEDDELLMRRGVHIGKTLHMRSMQGVDETLKKIYDTPVEKSIFFQPFIKSPAHINEPDLLSIKSDAKKVITDVVIPAFQKLGRYIQEEYIKHCREKEGITTISQGISFYKQCLKFHLSLDMDPQEVYDIGKREVARIKKQMLEVIKQLNFKGDFKDFVHDLRTNPKFYCDSEEELLEFNRDICYNKIRPKLAKLFKKIPQSKLIIEPAPDSRPNAPVGNYLAGTLDGSRPGIFYINAHELNLCPKYEAMALCLHEGEPGHHFQFMYALEDTDMPEFIQNVEDMHYLLAPSRFPLHTAYAEGWGLYCEYLGNELGLYEDPYMLFGHLSLEMLRACRLVADTGIHCFGWTFEQAVELFLGHSAFSESAVRMEVKRYITFPGQACAYKIGQIKIKELRDKAAQEMGDKFDVREFHEVVLKCGPSPLTKVEKLVSQYIESVNN